MSVFKEVKERVTTRDALAYLNIPVTAVEHGKHGEQLRCPCPKCGEKDKEKRCLSINTETGKFQCFSCEGKGNDFISLVHWVEKVSQTEAAERLKARYISATRPSSATKPEAKADGEGRSGAQVIEARPLELLGIDDELADRLQIEEEGSHVFFPMRDQAGVKLGTIAIATRADLPLVSWIAEAESAEEPVQASSLKDLWRMVKGAA